MFFPADEQQILGMHTIGVTRGEALHVNLMPLNVNRVIPVEVRAAGLPGDERAFILLQVP